MRRCSHSSKRRIIKHKCRHSLLSRETIEAAIANLEAQKQRIDEHVAELRRLTSVESSDSAPGPRARKSTSPAGRKRSSDAMRKRWPLRRRQAVSLKLLPRRRRNAVLVLRGDDESSRPLRSAGLRSGPRKGASNWRSAALARESFVTMTLCS